MIDTERINGLELRVAELEAKLEYESRQRQALPTLLVPAAAENKRGLETLEEHFGLTMRAIDDRIAALAQRVRSGAASDDREVAIQQMILEALHVAGELDAKLANKIIEVMCRWVLDLLARVLHVEQALASEDAAGANCARGPLH